jgi:flagellar biosynthetic protein FlhB
MAEQDDAEKTEDPTQKKLDDALEKGDVAKSQEVSTWFAMLGTGMVIAILAPSTAESLYAALRGYLVHAHDIPVGGAELTELWRSTGLKVAAILAFPLLLLLLLAVAGNMIQHNLVWTTERMKPKLEKISPVAGFKRLFSSESLVNFAKGLVKIFVVGGLMVAVIWPHRAEIDTMILRETGLLLVEVRDLILQLVMAVLGVMTVVAALDYLWQRKKWFEKQKMSQREIKDEYKQSEGDPLVKGKIRQLRMERSRKRMMASVPDATVVVTNPTHYAVALKYENGMQAPICVAKGTDRVALRIREVAKENEVPVIENPPLARALFASIDIEQEVPEDQYRAVAEVIGFVYRMRERKSWRG